MTSLGFILIPFYTEALSPEIYAIVALLAVLIAGIYNGIVEIPYHNIKLERQLGRPLFKGGWKSWKEAGYKVQKNE